MKWLLVTVLALVAFSGLRPWLAKLGLGRLPGDFQFTVRGRRIDLPLGTTLLLSVIAAGIARLF